MIKTLLERDLKDFKESDDSRLLDLEQVKSYKIPDVSDLPKLHCYSAEIKFPKSDDEFTDSIFSLIPILKKFNFNNLFIAGGAICSIIKNSADFSDNTDIDIFIYGLNITDANAKINECFKIIKHNNSYSKIIINNHSITIKNKDYKIQFILRLYTNKAQIISGFDLGSSAVGFDGKRLYFTELAAFAYKSMYNIVDLNRRSTTYELRLTKYLYRGFNIILPDLDLSKIVNKECFRLMNLTIRDFKMHKNNIIYANSIACGINSNSDYGSDDYDFVEHNIKNIINNKPLTYYKNNIKNITNIFDVLNTGLEKRSNIKNFYNKLKYKLTHKFDLCKISLFKNYFRKGKMILAALLISNDENTVDEIIQNELAYFENYNTPPCSLEWIVNDPQTQINGSFNPAIITTDEWYLGNAI